MEGQLFIRFRGRVLGPYDEDKLQSLARRGQLSRMHELSIDGVRWQRASDYPELFVNSVVVESPGAEPQGSVELTPALAPHASHSTPAQRQGPLVSSSWYYMVGNDRSGPVSYETLQGLSHAGEVRAHSLVWSDGMAAWTPAGQIPGLVGSAEEFDILERGTSPTRTSPSTPRRIGGSRAKKKNNTGLFIGLGVGGVVLIIVAIVAYMLLFPSPYDEGWRAGKAVEAALDAGDLTTANRLGVQAGNRVAEMSHSDAKEFARGYAAAIGPAVHRKMSESVEQLQDLQRRFGR